LVTYLRERAPELLNEPTRPSSAAESIVATCQRNGVALRLDPASGGLLIGDTGIEDNRQMRPWPSLRCALEAHLNAVAALVKSGWKISTAFPRDRLGVA
jgi:hypothetical protein